MSLALGRHSGMRIDGSSALNHLKNIQGDSALYPIIRLQYSAFHCNRCPSGFRDFKEGEQVFYRGTFWNLDLQALGMLVGWKRLAQRAEQPDPHPHS